MMSVLHMNHIGHTLSSVSLLLIYLLAGAYPEYGVSDFFRHNMANMAEEYENGIQ